MLRLILAVILVLHTATAAPARAQDASPPGSRPGEEILKRRMDSIASFVERARGPLGIPGVAVGVASGDSVLLARGFGRATVNGEPIDGRTPFLIGSVTKTLTATVIAQLADEGRLDFDAPVETYLPEFTMKAPFTPRSITVRHLLQHRSGLSQWSGHDSRAQHQGTVAHIAPRRRAGIRGEYSSLNYILLGEISERVSARSYREQLRASLLAPGAMHDAFVEGTESRPVGLANGHQSYFGVQIRRREPEPPRYLVPAGFVGASAHDLARFGGMLVGRGELAGERILDEETVATLLGPLDTVGLAMSWGRSRIDGRLVLEHAGNARTSSARVRLLPHDGYAIIVLANTNSGPFFSATGDVMNGIQAILDGERAPDVWPRERLFKGLLLIGTVWSLARLSQRAHTWNKGGRPTHLDANMRTLGPLAFDVAAGTALLYALPRYVGVPLGTMTEYFPDLGIALVTSAGAGVLGGVLKAWTRSAQP